MNLDDLEETLGEFLPAGFSIETNRKGEVIIYTNLKSDEDGELVDMDEDFEDSDLPSDDDTDSLDDLDEEDEDEED